LSVPNVPLLAALKKSKSLEILGRTGLDGILLASSPKEFQQKTVKEFLFGFSDSFVQMLPKIQPEQVGIMSASIGNIIFNSSKLLILSNACF